MILYKSIVLWYHIDRKIHTERGKPMLYVMSDLHGEYEKYRKMLELIRFSDADELFVLGDVVDRGAQPIEILLDMMARPNVYPIMGNHDAFAFYMMQKLAVTITQENAGTHLATEDMQDLIGWLQDGGSSTMAGFQKLSQEQRADVLQYLEEMPYYEAVDVGERTYILVHAGLANFRPDRKLSSYLPEELLLGRHDPDERYFADPDVWVIAGHTPTQMISGKPEIYHGDQIFMIDCGACQPGGRLGCLCLDTLGEFYIE